MTKVWKGMTKKWRVDCRKWVRRRDTQQQNWAKGFELSVDRESEGDL